MPQVKDLTGLIFGDLVVTYKTETREQSSNKPLWLCTCKCGETRLYTSSALRTKSRLSRSGGIISCGCRRKKALILSMQKAQELNTKYGQARKNNRTAEYNAWLNMKGRCSSQNSRFREYYLDRGITVCDKWLHSFEAFLADVGYRPSNKHSLDRINNNGNYSPGNVRWTTIDVQNSNKRTAKDLKEAVMTLTARIKVLEAELAQKA